MMFRDSLRSYQYWLAKSDVIRAIIKKDPFQLHLLTFYGFFQIEKSAKHKVQIIKPKFNYYCSSNIERQILRWETENRIDDSNLSRKINQKKYIFSN